MADKKSIDILADRVERLACAKCGHHMDLSDVEPFSRISCPECGTKQVAPMRLGSFLLLDEMGKGGMGSVYRAFDQTLGRYVAIKVMQRHLAADKKFSENFIREARATAALNHPNVVQVYACSQDKGQLYLVMELVDGGRLDEMIEGGKSLDEVFTLDVGTQVARGLQAANEIGLVHGDIKPANILFDRHNRAKVVDFGLARFAAKDHLQPGEIWGTPYYIAPEKVRAQKEDQRADIYSLGATLYHVLAGHPPFDGETAKEVVIARLKEPARSLRAERQDLQPETEEVLMRTLEQDPARRYPTYQSLLADLDEALRIARTREGRPASKEQKRSKLPLVLGGAVVLSILIGSVMFLKGDDEPPRPPPRTQRPFPVVEMPTVPTPTTPETPPDQPVDVDLPVQPFTAEHEAAVAKAVNIWVAGNANRYEAMFANLFEAVPQVGVERVWVSTLQAIPAWVDGRQTSVTRLLRGIPDATLRQLEAGQRHPGIMPQTLARFMVGRVNQTELERIAAEWPDWFGHLALFFSGAQELHSGDLDRARNRLQQYAGLSSGEVKWPYAYQPIAQHWIRAMEDWRAIADKATAQAPEEALRTLEQYRRNAPGFLHRAVDVDLRQARERGAAAEAERQKEAEHARQMAIEEEINRINAEREDLYPLVQSRDFARAAVQLRQRIPSPGSEKARAYRDRIIESYDRMEALKRLIIDGINRKPIPRTLHPELRGDTQGASVTGIRVTLGGHGTTTMAWNSIGERLFVTLAEYYLTDFPDQERADHILSLAVFAYQSRGMRPAKMYADQALEIDPNLRADAEALMPELEWN